ncbi:MAG: biopolymer transporter ExbD [Sneathiella sp.]|nr:biopolymer transporter ExbD [Sneathiella sp.]
MIQLSSDPLEGHDDASLYPDLTTLLDILFILLVFFILTAGVAYRSLDLTLPTAVSDELSSSETMNQFMLEIRAEGYALDGKYFAALDALKFAIKKAVTEQPNYKFVVAGDKSVSLERFLGLLTYLQSRGIETANILMKKESSS